MEEPKKLNIDLEFLDKKDSDPVHKKEEKKKDEHVKNKTKTNKVTNVRPWVRYWARYLDVSIFSFVFGVFAAIFGWAILEMTDIVLVLLILFLWIFVESILLSTWGITPGKWLLRITIKDKHRKKLTFSNALNRSFMVWFKGLGLGIPIISLFTLIFSYNRLTNRGITSWDEDGYFVVSHKKIGVARGTIATIAMVVFIYLTIISYT